MSGIVIILVTAYVFYENVYTAILLSPYMYIRLREQKGELIKRKKKELDRQFKDGMISVSFALNVGYSVENSFREAISELVLLYGKDSIIVREFRAIVRRTDRNEKLEDVLEDFAERSGVSDIEYFAAVFRYARSSGGDLISIIKNTAKTISDKIDTDNEIQLVVSGKKMEQKVMSFMPYGIIMYLKLSSPEFISPLYDNAIGAMIMTGCLMLYVLSDYMAKRMINIEV